MVPQSHPTSNEKNQSKGKRSEWTSEKAEGQQQRETYLNSLQESLTLNQRGTESQQMKNPLAPVARELEPITQADLPAKTLGQFNFFYIH